MPTGSLLLHGRFCNNQFDLSARSVWWSHACGGTGCQHIRRPDLKQWRTCVHCFSLIGRGSLHGTWMSESMVSASDYRLKQEAKVTFFFWDTPCSASFLVCDMLLSLVSQNVLFLSFLLDFDPLCIRLDVGGVSTAVFASEARWSKLPNWHLYRDQIYSSCRWASNRAEVKLKAASELHQIFSVPWKIPACQHDPTCEYGI